MSNIDYKMLNLITIKTHINHVFFITGPAHRFLADFTDFSHIQFLNYTGLGLLNESLSDWPV